MNVAQKIDVPILNYVCINLIGFLTRGSNNLTYILVTKNFSWHLTLRNWSPAGGVGGVPCIFLGRGVSLGL